MITTDKHSSLSQKFVNKDKAGDNKTFLKASITIVKIFYNTGQRSLEQMTLRLKFFDQTSRHHSNLLACFRNSDLSVRSDGQKRQPNLFKLRLAGRVRCIWKMRDCGFICMSDFKVHFRLAFFVGLRFNTPGSMLLHFYTRNL